MNALTYLSGGIRIAANLGFKVGRNAFGHGHITPHLVSAASRVGKWRTTDDFGRSKNFVMVAPHGW